MVASNTLFAIPSTAVPPDAAHTRAGVIRTTATPFFVPVPNGHWLEYMRLRFRDHRPAYNSGVRSTATWTFTPQQLMSGRGSGWTFEPQRDTVYTRNWQNFPMDNTSYTYYIDTRPVLGGVYLRIQDNHAGSSNQYGGYEDFSAVYTR